MICDRIRVLLASARGATVPIVSPTPSPSPTPTPTPTPTPSTAYDTTYMGASGPKVFVMSVWCQSPSLHATWKARGIMVMHTDFAEFADNYTGVQNGMLAGDAWNKSVKDNGLQQIRRPHGPNYGDLGTDGNGNPIEYQDFTAADKADPTVLWWPMRDEAEGEGLPITHYEADVDLWNGTAPVDKVKHITINHNGGNIGRQQLGVSSGVPGALSYQQSLDTPKFTGYGADAYPFQGYRKSYLGTAGTQVPGYFVNNVFFGNDPTLSINFTATWVGIQGHLYNEGPYAGLLLNSRGKWTFGNLGTGRVDLNIPEGDGNWQPGRCLRLFFWDMVLDGNSMINIFPQTPSTISGTGSVSGGVLTVTGMDTFYNGRPMNKLRAPLRVYNSSFQQIGLITGQTSSTETDSSLAGKGTYTLSGAVNYAGGAVYFNTPAFTNGDDSNAENLTELATCMSNLRTKLEAHPQGGNLLMDTTNGGRKAFTKFLMPSTVEDPNLHVDNMTAMTAVGGTGTTGWPLGFRGAEFTGADGKKYRVVLAYSTTATTSFTYAPWGVSGMSFGPCEVKLFTDASQTNQFAKAGVDD